MQGNGTVLSDRWYYIAVISDLIKSEKYVGFLRVAPNHCAYILFYKFSNVLSTPTHSEYALHKSKCDI